MFESLTDSSNCWFFSQYWEFFWGAESQFVLSSPQSLKYLLYDQKKRISASLLIDLALHGTNLKIVGTVLINTAIIWSWFTSQWGLTVTNRTPQYRVFQQLSSQWTVTLSNLDLLSMHILDLIWTPKGIYKFGPWKTVFLHVRFRKLRFLIVSEHDLL